MSEKTYLVKNSLNIHNLLILKVSFLNSISRKVNGSYLVVTFLTRIIFSIL